MSTQPQAPLDTVETLIRAAGIHDGAENRLDLLCAVLVAQATDRLAVAMERNTQAIYSASLK